VHDHHVREREAEEVIVANEQPLEYGRQVAAFRTFEVRYGGRAAPGIYVRLVGEMGVERDEGREVLAFGQYPAGVLVLLGEEVAVQAAAFVLRSVVSGRLQLFRGTRWDEWVAVDLSVRVVQGHPDSLALVLEDEDVIDHFPDTKLPVAVSPHLDQVPYAALAHGRKSRVVVI
jgi:hypothetical protein